MDRTDYTRLYDNGIAVMDLIGPIFPRANMMTLSGATSIEQFARDFITTYKHPDVKGIVLNIDSPGGDVRGIKAAADIIQKVSKEGGKPIQAFGAGLVCSAAYYIGSSVGAENIFADETGMAGSVGVVLTARAKGQGEYEIISSQSPNKRPDPSTKDGRSQLQQMADDVAQIFVRDVARYRGISEDDVLANYGKGASFVGPRALEAGLIDGISTLSAVVEKMASRTSTHQKSVEGSEALGLLLNLNEKEDNSMKAIDKLLGKFRASDETIVAGDEPEEDQDPTEEEETDSDSDEGQDQEKETAAKAKTKAAVVLSREELGEQYADAAELFATQLLMDNRILPSQQVYAATQLMNARIDDKLHPTKVDYIDAEGKQVTGTREDSIRAMFGCMPKHGLRAKAVKGFKEGTLTKVVVLDTKDNDKDEDTEMSEERRLKLLNSSMQGQTVLATSKGSN